MYANPRALEAPEIRHILPQPLMTTTLDASSRAVERAEGEEISRSDSPEGERHVLAGLSGRRKQVAELIARDMTNKEIAKVLGIAEGTVKIHSKYVFRILGVANRAMVAAKLGACVAVGKPGITLTPGIARIVRLVRDGRTNQQIAEQFGIRPGTVKSQLHTAFLATGTKTRNGLAAWAVRNLPAEG